MDQINFKDFSKVEFKIGEIKKAEEVEESEKLLRLEVDLGEKKLRTVFAGIKNWYSVEELLNKKTIFVTNIIPRKIMGEESEAMIFGAEDESEEKMSLLLLDKDLENGSKVF